MTVYADVLIILNLTVDYFLIRLTAKISATQYKTYRILLGALFGGISSLCIFLPQISIITDILFKILFAAVTVLIVFGYKTLKAFLRNTALLFAVSFAFAGAMLAISEIINPKGMAVNNSVVYFNISPVALIVFSVAAYFITALLRHLLSKNTAAKDVCKLKVHSGKTEVEVCAVIDSGNSLSDAFGMGEIIIADKKLSNRLFADTEICELEKRYRAIPCVTVSGTEILDGYRADKAYITCENTESELIRPIIAISKTPLPRETPAIINPRSI